MKTRLAAACLVLVLVPLSLEAQSPPRAKTGDDPLASIPPLASLVGRPASEMADVVERFTADQQSLGRRYDAIDSPAQRRRMHDFDTGWHSRLGELNFDKLSQEGRVDYVLLDNYLQHQVALLDRQEKMRTETAVLLPFADRLLALQDARRELTPIDPRVTARTLATLTHQVDSLRALFETPAGRGGGAVQAGDTARPRPSAPRVTKTVANRAADNLDQIRNAVTAWYRYYDGYDPTFSWWMQDPYRKMNDALTAYGRTLRERVVGFRPTQAVAAAAPAGGRGGGRGGDGGAGGGGRGATLPKPTNRSSAIQSAPRGSRPISPSR